MNKCKNYRILDLILLESEELIYNILSIYLMMEYRDYVFILIFVTSLILSYTLTIVDIANAQNVTTTGNVTQSINKTGLGGTLANLTSGISEKIANITENLLGNNSRNQTGNQS